MVVKGYSIDHSFKTRSDSTDDPRLERGRIEKKKKPGVTRLTRQDPVKNPVWFSGWPETRTGPGWKKNPVWPDNTQSKTRLQLVDFCFFY